MDDWLPSLNALRAFEATARHRSYARAADELRVTPAAVKQLVAKLEDSFGTRLVQRKGRGLSVTPAGQVGLDALSAGFGQIRTAASRIRAQVERRRLIVSVEPSFATAWLVPRLDRFRAHQPDVDVLIDSSLALADLARGAADVAIRFGGAAETGLIAHRLFDEELCALCSPSLVTGKAALRHLGDLERVTLIHWDLSAFPWALSTRRWMGWQPWLEALGATGIDWRRGLRFSDYNLALQAAIAGQGVVLGSLPVLRDLIEAGLLTCPFAESVRTDIGYDLVAVPQALGRPEVRGFADWITAEARGGAAA